MHGCWGVGSADMKLFLIISQVVYGLFLTLWFSFWALSAMLFDKGASATAISLFSIITAYPVAAVACAIIAWILYRKKKRKGALVVNLVPSLWVISILGALAWVEVQNAGLS